MTNLIKSCFFTFVLSLVVFEAGAAPATDLYNNNPENVPMVTGWVLEGQEGMPLGEFLLLTPKELKERTGQKLTLKERLALKYVQKNLKRSLKKGHSFDETIDLNVEERRFNLGGFLLGFFFGLIGFLISLLFKNRNVRRSALLGWGVAVLVYLIILVSA